MLNDTDLPDTHSGGPDAGSDTTARAAPAAPPARCGRLALGVAAASALAFGVIGTVAYGVWFNHDQQAYAEAMASARQALGVTASASSASFASSTSSAVLPTSAALVATAATGEEGKEQASWSGQVMRSQQPSSAPPEAAAADALPASSLQAARGRASSRDSAAQQPVAVGRAGRDGRLAPHDRRLRPASAKPKGGLFARMGLFFRRVNYRQHGTGRQQDPYAHS